MGFRIYLAKMNKEDYRTITEELSKEELIENYGDGFEDDDPYFSIHKLPFIERATLCFGDECFIDIKKLNKPLEKHFPDETFHLLEENDIKAILENIRKEVVDFYSKLWQDAVDGTKEGDPTIFLKNFHFRKKSWEDRLDSVLNMSKECDNLVEYAHYEYFIFDVLNFYKNLRDNEVPVMYGW